MKLFTLALSLLAFSASLFAQNVVISTQNPDGLYVCGTDQMGITLQNGAGSPAAANLRVIVTFPAGITYQPGTVAGATENNISNLNAPVFALNDLAGGATASFTLSITADCPVVQAINSGQTFSNTIVANYTGGSKQLISNFYPVETAFINIGTVTPPTVTAQKGDVIMRMITVKNTRNGPIQSLRFTDSHFPGLSIDLQGGVNQVNAGTFFFADVPGSLFSTVGNFDNFLDKDEEITLIEKVTVEDCGIPSFTNQSLIVIGWGCTGPTNCQQDSVYASITILPTTQNPNLSFVPVYAPPLSQCGLIPSVQEILIINNGELPATNVQLAPYTLDTLFHAIDQNSFEWNNGSGWQPLPSGGSVPGELLSCEINLYSLVAAASVPEVPPGDTVRLRFNTYYCQPICGGLIPAMRVGFIYEKACPPNSPVGGVFDFFPDTNFLKITAGTKYELENCLQDGDTYNIEYWVKSGRLKQDTGYLQVIFNIPLGFDWLQDCPFNLDGQTPLDSEVTQNPDGSSTVSMVFDLPFSQDSVSTTFCLLYHCEQGMPCQATVPNIPPRGLDYTVYPPPSDCGGCQLRLESYTLVSTTPDETIDCAITFCDEFILVVDDQCDTTGGGGGGGGGGLGEGNLVVVDFDSYRVNYGMQDNNDDRMADNNSPANAPGVRRDRFLVGDTLRTELRAVMLQGTLDQLSFRVFLESWQSDFDTLDGDSYDLAMGKLLFVNYDTTSFVSAHLTIKTAGGQQYDCDIPLPGIKSDQHIIQVAEPNIRPPQIVDVLGNMFHQYDLDFASLDCLPPDFVLAQGDSLIFTSDYKFEYNFTPNGSNAPPLINFRNSICDTEKTYSWELNDFCTEKEINQFSGYLEVINPNAHRIEPCSQSTELSPFQYIMRIARPNMFPFEVRQLSTVTNYSYSLPTNVGLVESRLNYLTLQDNVQLFGVTPLTPGFGGDSMRLDLSPYFSNLIDEGYSFEISTRFDTTCGYNGTVFGRTVLGMRYANMCIHNPINDSYYIVNPNGYQNGSPKIEFFSPDNIYFLPTSEVDIQFFLRNNSQVTALNSWIYIESDGDLADIQLLDAVTGLPIPQVGGLYQLGDMAMFANPAFRFIATNRSCRTVKLTIHFGWACAPVFNAYGGGCGNFSETIELRAQPPELELTIINEPPSIPMCQPSGFFEFEISNANDGTAYDVLPSIKLPPGIRIAPGTSQLSYPAGGAFVNMPDPVEVPGNIWQFDPEAASSLLASDGLISADQDPLNALRIRFKVIAECGAVANAQPIYGAESIQSCGIISNVLRKPGEPMMIEGVEPSYTAVSNLNFSNPPGNAGCGEEVQLTASIAVNDTPMPGDSIYILLPTGTSYVAGSYDDGANAPAGPPQVSGQQLQLPLPSNIGAGTIMEFTFSIRYDDPAGCADKFVILQTREKTEAFCQSNNQFCDIYVATGESLLNLNAQNPELQFNSFSLNTQGGQTTFNAVLENAGDAVATDPVVEIYHDQNGNNQIDPGEPVVATVNTNGTIPAGGILPVSGNLNNLPVSAYCDLIALIPADENCACADHVFPLAGNQIVTQGIGLCQLQNVNVGTPEVSGNTYTWLTPDGLNCVNCANATYTPGPDIQPGELVTLVLQEQSSGCTIERRFEIQFGGDFGIETESQTICEGDPITLESTPGGSVYNWSGPGITNPNQQNQVIQPTAGATYFVTVTFSGGCTGTGSVQVFVNPASQTQLPPITTCEGEPVLILGQTTDVPGVYTLELIGTNGCDSLVTRELIVVETQTSETRVICPGGSTPVFDSVFTTAGNLCRTFTNSANCDSTHCVTVNQVPNPEIPEQDSALVIALGESVVIETPDDYASYEWSPFDPDVLECSDCPDPSASPDTSTTFLLVVRDGNGCIDSAEYRVYVCDENQIFIPNAFSPNGDGANDLFRVVPSEGADVVLSLEVYSRWGQKIFEGSGTSAAWDGTIGDKPAPSDVYVYVIKVECGGNTVVRSREVTLIR